MSKTDSKLARKHPKLWDVSLVRVAAKYKSAPDYPPFGLGRYLLPRTYFWLLGAFSLKLGLEVNFKHCMSVVELMVENMRENQSHWLNYPPVSHSGTIRSTTLWTGVWDLLLSNELSHKTLKINVKSAGNSSIHEENRSKMNVKIQYCLSHSGYIPGQICT